MMMTSTMMMMMMMTMIMVTFRIAGFKGELNILKGEIPLLSLGQHCRPDGCSCDQNNFEEDDDDNTDGNYLDFLAGV